MYYSEPLLIKEVDWSLLNIGLTLPVRLNNVFSQRKEGNKQKRGESKEIRIILNNKLYYAKVNNVNYSTHSRANDTLQIRYSKNSDLSKELRKIFESYNYILKKRLKNKQGDYFIRLPEGNKEFISIHGTEHREILFFKPIYSREDNSKEIRRLLMDSGSLISKDIKEYVNEINNDQNKTNRWVSYIIDYHNSWGNLSNSEKSDSNKKTIWGQEIHIDPDAKITDVFDGPLDSNIVDYLSRNDKAVIGAIDENDIVNLMFESNFGFKRFKRVIDTLFTKQVEETNNNNISDENALGNSFYIIEQELVTLANSVSKYGCTIEKLKESIDLKDKEIFALKEKLESKNNTINQNNKTIDDLKETIKYLDKETEEKRKALSEVENIKASLKLIEQLLID